MEQGEELLVVAWAPGCAHLAAGLPQGKEGRELRAGTAKRRKLSRGVKSYFSYLSTKTMFQENNFAVCF